MGGVWGGVLCTVGRGGFGAGVWAAAGGGGGRPSAGGLVGSLVHDCDGVDWGRSQGR